MNAHFCFSELLILGEKKDARIFFWAIGVPKKLQIFKNIGKTLYTIVELHKKGTILHQAPQITLFFDSPIIYLYIYRVIYITR